MNRSLVAFLAATTLGTASAPTATASAAATAGHCRPRAGEHQLARSAQAIVFERMTHRSRPFPTQTISGCSRRSGKRRTIDTLQRRGLDDRTKLIGLRLAGTRIAYVMVLGGHTTIVADDALHGGRRHDLGAAWAFGDYLTDRVRSWSVDAEGDVAWIASGQEDDANELAARAARQSLVVWRPGLGLRQVDARAVLDGLRLRDGELGWRRDATRRAVDLAAVPRSACRPGARAGTLAVDFYGLDSVCLRATGRTVPLRYGTYGGPYLTDANGSRLVYRWSTHANGAYVVDLTTGDVIDIDPTPGDPVEPVDLPFGNVPDAVVDDDGSVAWLDTHGALWVRDAGGTRAVPGQGAGPLLRDGSTVTWSGGGPTATLAP
jgi:hypothetical protein